MSSITRMSLLRSLAWRIGRRLYCWARNDLPVPPASNGEYNLLQACIFALHTSRVIVVFDIGANKGEWSEHALSAARERGVDLSVHAFEPASDTYAYLLKIVRGRRRSLEQSGGFGQLCSGASVYIKGSLCGVNSLYGREGAEVELVQTVALDDYVSQQGIESIDFIKTDAEGHDIHVMFGAEQTLRDGRVEIWQFEYNHRWIEGRHYLKDVFEYIADKPYMIGKLHRTGIEIFEAWHPELERFFESNYVLIRRDCDWIENFLLPVGFDYRNVLVPRQGFIR